MKSPFPGMDPYLENNNTWNRNTPLFGNQVATKISCCYRADDLFKHVAT